MIQGVSPQIDSILSAGNHASSHMNTQPWRFVVKGEHVDIFSIPDRDTTLYNTGNRLTLFSIGGVVENMSLAAATLGMRATVTYFPAGETGPCVSLDLVSDPAIQKSELEQHVLLRATNRKRFIPVQLSDMEMREIESSVSSFGITSKLITDRKDIKSLAMLIAKEQDVVFSNADLHKFYFENIMWSAAELEAKKTGLDPKTLEISGSSLPMYYMISNWDFLQSISALRPSSYITSAHASIYATAAAIGAITIDSERPQDFIIAGRAFERLWLTVTKLGLNLEPLLGIPFLKLGIENNPTALNTSQTEIIESGYKEINRMFVFDGKRVAALFRVGGGTPSQYHSVRKDLSAVVTAL